MNRSCNMSRCARSSSSLSSSSWRLRNVARIRESNTRNIPLPLTLQSQYAPDHPRDPFPGLSLTGQLSASSFGDRIELRTPVALRRTPFRPDPALARQAQQRREYCARVQPEQGVADLFDASCDSIPVLRAQRIEGFEDHQVESALQDFRPFLWHGHRSGSIACFLWSCQRSATPADLFLQVGAAAPLRFRYGLLSTARIAFSCSRICSSRARSTGTVSGCARPMVPVVPTGPGVGSARRRSRFCCSSMTRARRLLAATSGTAG